MGGTASRRPGGLSNKGQRSAAQFVAGAYHSQIFSDQGDFASHNHFGSYCFEIFSLAVSTFRTLCVRKSVVGNL